MRSARRVSCTSMPPRASCAFTSLVRRRLKPSTAKKITANATTMMMIHAIMSCHVLTVGSFPLKRDAGRSSRRHHDPPPPPPPPPPKLPPPPPLDDDCEAWYAPMAELSDRSKESYCSSIYSISSYF